MRVRRYSELIQFDTFDDRFNYLKLGGQVGAETFGFDRYLNQNFYTSREWKQIREQVIVRDNGCDLGLPGFEIHYELLVHHINPMQPSDIIHGEDWILNPDFLITTTKTTHNAIHYGSSKLLFPATTTRHPGDTKLW